MKTFLSGLICLFLFESILSAAVVPDQVNYQGFLTDPDGAPMDTVVEMEFSIFSVSSGGISLWSETHDTVQVTNGLFDVRLGELSPLSPGIFQSDSLWLGISVGRNPAMTPRVRFLAVPYAYRVSTVDQASGGTITSDVNINGKANIGSSNVNSGIFAFTVGQNNSATGSRSTITGGANNIADSLYSTIAGGYQNNARHSCSFVGGGNLNTASGQYSTVAGGIGNTAEGLRSFIGGGYCDTASGQFTVIAGGSENSAEGDFATIGGGYKNEITSYHSVIAGGCRNACNGNYSAIAGGDMNIADGTNSTISGGYFNYASWIGATVTGGAYNIASGLHAWVGGGKYCRARGDYSVVAGGGGYEYDSCAAIGDYSAVGGGRGSIAEGSHSTVSGGMYNKAIGTGSAVVCGQGNLALGDYSFVGGGGGGGINDSNCALGNQSTVSGGRRNRAGGLRSVVCGGDSNIANGSFSTVPGGSLNQAAGDFSFAAGYGAQALNQGSFVWTDATGASLSSSSDNQFAARASGGVYFYTNSSATSGSYLAAGSGTWQSVSDSTKKRNIRLVDTRSILEKVAALPIKQWSYKAQDPSIEHIGPMAQDFYNAFHVGDDPLTISTIDPSGVALAAIQELQKEIIALRAEVKALREERSAAQGEFTQKR